MKGAMKLSLDTNIHVRKGRRGSGIAQEMSFKNVVLNIGRTSLLSRIMNDDSNADNAPMYLYLGTGTTTPTPDDPGLESPSSSLSGKRAAHSSHDGDDSLETHLKYTSTLRFDYEEGEAEGTWTELGLAFGESYNEPYNRSLFKDKDGNPVSITVLSDEYLQVFVDLIMYVPFGEVASGTIVYDGNQHSWLLVGDRFNGPGATSPFRDLGIFNRPNVVGLENGADNDYSRSIDVENATVKIDLHVRHGQEIEIEEVRLTAYRVLRPERTHHVYFDPPILKKYEDRLFGEIEYSLDIGEVPE